MPFHRIARTLSRSLTHTRCSAALAAALAVIIPTLAGAGAAFEAVWFPFGNITFHIANDAEGARDEITDAMTFMNEHTPLEITETSSESSADLHFEASWVSPNGGGYTYAYWDENRVDSNQKIRFDPNHLPSRGTIAHEFGHALGFPHEFQRDDRDSYVDVCFNTDPFNYSKMGSAFWPDPYENLSPYDFASVMNDGYSSCVDPLSGQDQQSRFYDGVTNLLSVHDINSIYRMYGESLGPNNQGDRFGVAVSSGDYDDDGYKDVVVANVQGGGIWLSFYRGVGTALSEGLTGLKWMPWFKVNHTGGVSAYATVTLATGDFNGDGIDDLALGDPGYNFYQGRVSILFVNSLPSDPDKDTFQDDFAPWGRKGIQYRIDIEPGTVGLSAPGFYPQFGASLAAIRGTNFRNDDGDTIYHDLVIGAPFAAQANVLNPVARGAIAIIKGRIDTSPSDFSVATNTVVWSPSLTVSEFGAAVAAVPGLCYTAAGQTSKFYTDFIAVGAPRYASDNGAAYVYGCSTTGSSSTLVAPGLQTSLYATGIDGRYGHSLAGFRVFDGVYRKSYLVVGQPKFQATDGLQVGRVSLYEVGSSTTFRNSFVPSVHDGADEFGYALAVHQHAYSDSVTDEGGASTYIGIGMPGARISGLSAGKVHIWRVFYNPTSTSVVEATDPDGATNTRFGESIAVVRTLRDSGGFVAGAPNAIVDGVQAGEVSTLQNDFGPAGWSTIKRNLDQETEGDQLASNR